MKVRFLLLLFVIYAMACQNYNAQSFYAHKETVILLHGMGRTSFSMCFLGKRFEDKKYDVLYFSYNEKDKSLDEISEELREFITTKVKTSDYHLIGHSLGNVVVRNAFRQKMPLGLGRCVMLAPPNQAANLAKLLRSNCIYQWRTGDCGQKLANDKFYDSLPLPDCEYGIIAGNKGQNITFSEPNDGVVAVETTKLRGSKDWLALDHSHTFIMNAKDTFEHCYHFINYGEFR